MGAEMGFWDHVEALRGVVLKIALLLVVASAGWFVAMPYIFDSVILGPCHRWGADRIELVNISLTAPLLLHLSTSLWMAVVTVFPVALYILWGFVAPGLYENERRGVSRAFLGGVALFYAGVATGYFAVFPLTLRFLADYRLSEAVPNTISLDSYMDNFLMLIFVMGLVFELPVVAWMLGRLGLIDRKRLARYRRHAIVALLVLAALITPTGDPLTLLVVFLPVYMLWELGALLTPPGAAVSGEQTIDNN